MDKLNISVDRVVLKLSRQILYALLSFTVVSLFTPLIFVFCIPIYCFRFVIRFVARFIRPDLAEMLESRSTWLGTEDVYRSPYATLVVTWIMEGEMTDEYIHSNFQRMLTIKRDNGKLKYKQLSERLTKWMGFLFWTKDKKFDLKNHIKHVQLDDNGLLVENRTGTYPEIHVSQLKAMEKQLIKTPYPLNRSPWDLSIVNNLTPKVPINGKRYQAVLFRYHHSLHDGYSILKMLLVDFVGQQKSSIKVPHFPKNNILIETFLNCYATLKAPFGIMSQVLTKPDNNGLHLPVDKLHGSSNFHLVESDLIPLDYLKAVKNRHGVQLKTVLFAACTSAIRNLMLKRGIEIPETITSLVPFPFPGHPDKMGNYWSAMAVNFPVGMADKEKRLKFIKKNMDGLRHSTAALTAFKIQPLLGSLFHWMVKPMSKLMHPTALSSDFPGPTKEVSTPDFKVIDAYWVSGLPNGNCGLLFISNSYNGYWKMNISVDHGIMSSDAEAEEFLNDVINELSDLHAEILI